MSPYIQPVFQKTSLSLIAWVSFIIFSPPGAQAQSILATTDAKPVLLPAPKTAESATEVSLILGEIKMLPIVGKVTRIALGNGAYVSATTVDSDVMLIGEQPGITSLMVWSGKNISRYQIRVIPRDIAESRRFLESLLSENDKVQIKEVNSKLIVSGTLQKSSYKLLEGLISQIPELVLNAREDVSSPFVRSLVFKLHFIEVKNDFLQKLGIQWAKDTAGPVIGAQGIGANSGIYRNIPQAQANDNLLAADRPFVSVGGRTSGLFLGLASTIASRINFGISTGDIHIHASPTLSAKSGGEAKLLVGGEVPIPQAGPFGAVTVIFKPYGINFEIQPTVSDDGIITAKLSTELSQIDPAVTVSGIPGFLTRKTSTDISVKAGEMIALSGLLNSEFSNGIDKVPGLGNIPVLGRLFRSDDFRNKKSDLVVLLEPEIVMSTTGIASELRERGLQNVKQYKEKIEEMTNPKKSPQLSNDTEKNDR